MGGNSFRLFSLFLSIFFFFAFVLYDDDDPDSMMIFIA